MSFNTTHTVVDQNNGDSFEVVVGRALSDLPLESDQLDEAKVSSVIECLIFELNSRWEKTVLSNLRKQAKKILSESGPGANAKDRLARLFATPCKVLMGMESGAKEEEVGPSPMDTSNDEEKDSTAQNEGSASPMDLSPDEEGDASSVQEEEGDSSSDSSSAQEEGDSSSVQEEVVELPQGSTNVQRALTSLNDVVETLCDQSASECLVISSPPRDDDEPAEATRPQKRGKSACSDGTVRTEAKRQTRSQTRSQTTGGRHDELLATLRPSAMEKEIPLAEFDYPEGADKEAIASRILTVYGQLRKLKLHYYVYTGRLVQDYERLGGTQKDIQNRLQVKDRHLEYCKTAYKFCFQYPLLLFYQGSWSSIRDQFSALRKHIETSMTQQLWQLPEESPNADFVAHILGKNK